MIGSSGGSCRRTVMWATATFRGRPRHPGVMRTTRAPIITTPVPRTGSPHRVVEAGPTAAGRILQAAWLGYVGYGVWAAVAGPEHPEPAAVWRVPLLLLGLAVLAVTAGLVRRRRWALQASAVLSLPLVALAVWCFAADAGAHWVAEAVFAAVVLGGSLHPGSWRMHDR